MNERSKMNRSDDDSWDLASSVGATATMVAALQRAIASRGPNPSIDDPYAELLVRAVGADPVLRLLDGESNVDGPAFDEKQIAEQWPYAPDSSTTCSRRQPPQGFVRR